MEAMPRLTTLAAETFRSSPALRRTAKRSSRAAQLRKSARTVKDDAGRTFFLVEGDLLYDEDELELYALQQEARSQAIAVGLTPTPTTIDGSSALVAAAPGGKIVRWKPGLVLRYAVLRKSFLNKKHYDVVRAGMAEAAAAWEETCGVDFEHASDHDDHPDPTTSPDEIADDLIFTVRHLDQGGAFIALAFFPSQPPARRRVFIGSSYFSRDLRFDRVGVLRHELGHVLGFRHEHIRSGAPPACPDEPGYDRVDLTEYDPQSVMHYFCGGVGSPMLEITELDRIGAQKVYGPPFSSLMLVE